MQNTKHLDTHKRPKFGVKIPYAYTRFNVGYRFSLPPCLALPHGYERKQDGRWQLYILFLFLSFSMGVHFAMFLFIALLVVAWPLSTQARMFIDCTFGKINTPEGQKMTAKFTANLAAFKHFSHSCFVKSDGQNQNHFLQVRAKRNNESKGEHIFIRFFTF